MRALWGIGLGGLAGAGCTFDLPQDDGVVASDPCGAVASGTQVGDEGTDAIGWFGRILSTARLDAPTDGQVLVEGPIDVPPELWVDGALQTELATDTLRYDPQPYDVRSVILPPDGGWPVGAALEIRAELPVHGTYSPGTSNSPAVSVFAFEAVDAVAPSPARPSWLQFSVYPWQGLERQTVVTAHFPEGDPWATVQVRGPDGLLFGLEPATGDQATDSLFEARESCEDQLALPCVEAQLFSASREAGPPLSECAPAQQ